MSVSRLSDLGSSPIVPCGAFSRSSHPSDFKIGSLVVIGPVLGMACPEAAANETASLNCDFYLRVAARVIV